MPSVANAYRGCRIAPVRVVEPQPDVPHFRLVPRKDAERKPGQPVRSDEATRIVAALVCGRTSREVAEAFRRSHNTILEIAKANGLKAVGRGPSSKWVRA